MMGLGVKLARLQHLSCVVGTHKLVGKGGTTSESVVLLNFCIFLFITPIGGLSCGTVCWHSRSLKSFGVLWLLLLPAAGS